MSDPAPPGATATERKTASAPATTAAAEQPAAREPAASTAPAVPVRAVLRLTAARGDCWVEVRAGSESGRPVFAGILAQGESRRFSNRSLWIVLGAPDAIDATLNGRPVENLPQGAAAVLATPRGVRTLSPL